MFMVKDEYANIKKLLRVRIRTQGMGFKWLFILLGLFVFAPFAGTVLGVLRSDFVRFYNTADLSVTLLFGIVIGYFIQMLMYKSTNDSLSVYPQTNNSRFISSLLYNFIGVFALALVVLAVHFIQYGTILLLSVFVDNVRFALDFDLGFIVVGFFVYVAYCFLLVAVVELAGVILRKWTYYAIVAFTAALSLAIANFSTVIENVQDVLAFLTQESSIIVFFLKAIALFLAITAIAVVINRYTVYYKNHGRGLNKSAVLGCIVMTVVVTVAVQSALFRWTAENLTTSQTSTITAAAATPIDDFLAGREEIRINISHLPRGSNIEVRIEERSVRAEVVTGAGFFSETPVFVRNTEALRNIQGDTLILSYRPPFFHANGITMTDFAGSQLIAYLEGNVLFVDNILDNVQVVSLPVWGIARQFDFFRDRDVFRVPMIGTSVGGNISADVWVRVE